MNDYWGILFPNLYIRKYIQKRSITEASNNNYWIGLSKFSLMAY